MIPATLLALLATAAPVPAAPSARVLLKPAAASAPSCRTTKLDAQSVQAPLFSPESAECPVANVAGSEIVVLRELADALETGHMAHNPRAAAPKKKPDMDFHPALDRIIASRLLVIEAREMGLDQDKDFRANVDSYKAAQLRSALQRDAAKSVKPDKAEVDKLYREAVREWKVKSVLVEKEDVAKAFEAALKAGGNFDAVAKKFVGEKKAKGGGPAEFVPPQHVLPEVSGALAKAKPGAVVGPVKVPTGWAFMRVDGARYPKGNQKALAEARARSQARLEHEAVRKFYLSLVKQHAKIDEALLKKLDFEAGGAKGFEALLKDQRTLVAIAGDKPITVGDLTREISMKFFHGIESPIQQKRVNPMKNEAFEKLLGSRLMAKEAAARKLADNAGFKRDLADYERGLLFNTFVEKVIVPDVKVTEKDAIEYYEQHKAEFTAPQMYKLDGFAFPTTKEAQSALDKLKGGTDFSWLRSTAPGQIAPEKRTLQFDGQTLSVNALPKDLSKVLIGSRTGDFRLYAAGPAEVYVLRVVDQTAPAPQPYAEARESIAKKLFNEKLAQGITDYAGKLRKAQKVDVLITRVSM